MTNCFRRRILLAFRCVVSVVLTFAACAGYRSGVHAQEAPASKATIPVSPRDLADTWQGTLHAGRDLRLIVKITKDEKGAYKGVFYSIDQGGQPLNLDSVTANGSEVKMELKLIGGKFEGKLSADGKTIDGNWS